MRVERRRRIALLAIVAGLWATEADAQGLSSSPGTVPVEPSMLGPVPGETIIPGSMGGQSGAALSTRPGAGSPRVPLNAGQPGGGVMAPTPTITSIGNLPPVTLPAYGPLTLPTEPESEGPPGGMTLDDAIGLLIQNNLDLRAQFLEIPQARADVLTASLRANPILFWDAQLIPYGSFNPRSRPGGQTQYDVNVNYPIDISRKIQRRMDYAGRAVEVIEAQYQDAVRRQINNLYIAFVDVLAARETVRFYQASIEGADRLLEITKSLQVGGERTIGDVNRVVIQRNQAEIALADGESKLRAAKRQLGALMNIPPEAAEEMAIRGTLTDKAPPPPPAGSLLHVALEARPDLAAARMGVGLAESGVRLAKAERFQDVYLLYQPYTFQNNAPTNQASAYSYALGMTVPLPIYNRNQGVIRRARVNVTQSRTQVAALQRLIVTEVRAAAGEYAISRSAVERTQGTLLPSATQVLREALRLYREGEESQVVLLNAQRDYNDVVRQYRDALIRHRRSMLALNTVLGVRILP